MTRRKKYGLAALVLLLVLVLTWRRWLAWMIRKKWPEHAEDFPNDLDYLRGFQFSDLMGVYFNGHPSWFPDVWQPVVGTDDGSTQIDE